MELNLTLTTDQLQLLNNILFDDCTYLETCNENEFDSYKVIRNKVTTIVNTSVDYQDSEILEDWEDLFDVHTVLESVASKM